MREREREEGREIEGEGMRVGLVHLLDISIIVIDTR